MRCLLDDLRVFGMNAEQWMTVAQNEGEWSKTEEQEAECFMVTWTASEKTRAGLRHEVVYLRT